MKLNAVKTFSIALLAFGLNNLNAQQLKVPAASPAQTVKQAFALSDITIEYARPSAKGRVVYGDVVPFGTIWRTGANNSTKITFGEDVKVEGNDVKAGTYALYSVPNKDSWELMLYKDLTLGGNVADYKKENEVIRFTIKPTALTEKVETFQINVQDITSNSANIELIWEKTRVAFKVVADIDSKIMKSIENTVMKDTRPYYQAASYYYENDKDLKLAAEWIDKAVANNPKAYWVVLLKAKILFKAKDLKGAQAAAEQSKALATEDKDDAYVKMADKIIADCKKK
jgi:tetratricopeptide (TPR) repeat protein